MLAPIDITNWQELWIIQFLACNCSILGIFLGKPILLTFYNNIILYIIANLWVFITYNILQAPRIDTLEIYNGRSKFEAYSIINCNLI